MKLEAVFILLIVSAAIRGTLARGQDVSQGILPKEVTQGGQQLFKVIPQNLIKNGNFGYPRPLPALFYSKTKEISEWQLDQLGLIGSGKAFNNKWGNKVNVVKLDVNHNIAYHKLLNLSEGYYYAAFDFAPQQDHPLRTSQIHLSWNARVFLQISPAENAVFTQSLFFKTEGEAKTLTFTGAGASDDVGATISNLRVFKIVQQNDTMKYFLTPGFVESGFAFQQVYYQQNLLASNIGQEMSRLTIKTKTYSFTGTGTVYYASFDFRLDDEETYVPIAQTALFCNGEEVMRFYADTAKLINHVYVYRVQAVLYGKVGSNTLEFVTDHDFKSANMHFGNFKVHQISNTKLSSNQRKKKPKKDKSAGGASLFSVIPSNFVQNGDFTETYSTNPTYTTNLRGWECKKAEIGKGSLYNPLWGQDINVAELDVVENTAYNLVLNLRMGNYYAAFDWAPRTNADLKTSQIELKWNGNVFKRLVPPYNTVFTESFAFYSEGRQNKLTLTGAGPSDTVGATIANVRVYRASNSEGYFSTSGFMKTNFTYHQGYQRYNLAEPHLGQHLSRYASKNVISKFVGKGPVYYADFDFHLLVSTPYPLSSFRMYINSRLVTVINPVLFKVQRMFVVMDGRPRSNTLKFKCSRQFKDSGIGFSNFEIHSLI